MRRFLFSYHHILSRSCKSPHIVAFRAWHPEVILIIFFSLITVSVKSIPKHSTKNLNSSCQFHRNLSDKTASLLCYGRDAAFQISLCFHALSRAILISTTINPFIFRRKNKVSMPSIGQSSFLPCPLRTSCLSRFAGSFLHVFFQSCLIINYNKGQKWAEGKLFF